MSVVVSRIRVVRSCWLHLLQSISEVCGDTDKLASKPVWLDIFCLQPAMTTSPQDRLALRHMLQSKLNGKAAGFRDAHLDAMLAHGLDNEAKLSSAGWSKLHDQASLPPALVEALLQAYNARALTGPGARDCEKLTVVACSPVYKLLYDEDTAQQHAHAPTLGLIKSFICFYALQIPLRSSPLRPISQVVRCLPQCSCVSTAYLSCDTYVCCECRQQEHVQLLSSR